MTVNAVVLMPWRGGDPAREKAQVFTFLYYAGLGYQVVEADDGSDPFNRAGSRNKAAVMAGDWEVAIVADADCVVHGEVLETAIERATKTSKVIIPHDHFMELVQRGSDRAIQEPNIALWRPEWAVRPDRQRKRPSGVLVFPRAAWDIVGGYDQRFTGWGFEDTAMLWALEDCAWGYERINGLLWHLWHPESVRTWLRSDKALFERYKQAHGDGNRMLALLNERIPANVMLPT